MPTYKPMLHQKCFDPDPAFPDSYKPGLFSDALFDTDTYTGFSGGDVAPWFPAAASRFSTTDREIFPQARQQDCWRVLLF